MKTAVTLLLSILLCSFTTVQTTDTTASASLKEFKFLSGTHTGTLGYKDYTGGEWVELKLVGAIHIKNDKLVIKHLIVEGEKLYDQNYSFDFKGSKATVNGDKMDVIENTFNTDSGSKKLVLTHKGKDGNKNRKCTFRYTAEYKANVLTISKEVKFDDENDYFLRNKYTLNK